MLKQLSICLLIVSTSLGDKIKYPEVRRDVSVVDEYYGSQVSDPYRSLEDPDSEEVKKFVLAQNSIADEYLNEVSDKSAGARTVRGDILKTLTESYSYPKYSLPEKVGSRYVFFMNTGLQNQRYVAFIKTRGLISLK
jgi:prolyl oligopeptidase